MKKLLLSVSAIFALTTTAMCSPTTTTAQPKKDAAASSASKADQVAATAAKTELVTLTRTLKNAQGLSYSSQLSYAVPGASGPVITEINTEVTIERPAKLSIKTSANGKPLSVLNASGSNFIIYDVPAGKYSQESTTPDIKGTLTALGDTGRSLYAEPDASGESLRAALGFPISFLNGEFFVADPPPGAAVHFSSVPETLNSKLVHRVTETLSEPGQGVVKLIFIIDPKTGLPSSQIVQEIPPAKNAEAVTVVKEDFSGFKALSAPSDVSTYGFTPPSTATLVPIAPEVPPGTAPDGSTQSPNGAPPTTPSAPSTTPSTSAPAAPGAAAPGGQAGVTAPPPATAPPTPGAGAATPPPPPL